jgi:hypothetical protein
MTDESGVAAASSSAGRRHALGLVLIILVALIWVASAEVSPMSLIRRCLLAPNILLFPVAGLTQLCLYSMVCAALPSSTPFLTYFFSICQRWSVDSIHLWVVKLQEALLRHLCFHLALLRLPVRIPPLTRLARFASRSAVA